MKPYLDTRALMNFGEEEDRSRRVGPAACRQKFDPEANGIRPSSGQRIVPDLHHRHRGFELVQARWTAVACYVRRDDEPEQQGITAGRDKLETGISRGIRAAPSIVLVNKNTMRTAPVAAPSIPQLD
ncbi:MAG TPA: hypothetical protein VHK27_07990, partial [Gammaproteobacteria bacterium]|nr:hypothetical protein [Gammaproteobacteria bacterium]